MSNATTISESVFDKSPKLSSYILAAVRSMEKCCDKGYEGQRPVAISEVYNETWLLRLVLAYMHDYDGDITTSNDKEKTTLCRIRNAVRNRWISEGGLPPVFDDEGTTWTDAILGDVSYDEKTKRGIKLAGGSRTGVVVVEAKMGSALSRGTTHHPEYNQAARNIACLAQLVKGDLNLAEKSSFVVLAPQKKLADWMKAGYCPQRLIVEARNAIDESHSCLLAAEEKIIDNSIAMSWEDVINSMRGDGIEDLKDFYRKTCNQYGVVTPL